MFKGTTEDNILRQTFKVITVEPAFLRLGCVLRRELFSVVPKEGVVHGASSENAQIEKGTSMSPLFYFSTCRSTTSDVQFSLQEHSPKKE